MKKIAPLLVLAAATLWGAMGIVTRYVASVGFHSRQTAAVRVSFAAVSLLLFLFVTDRKKLYVKREDYKWFLATGVLSLFVNNLAYAVTVQRASLSAAVVLLYTAPFFVLLLSAIWLKEKMTIAKVAALCLSFAGCILVVGLSGADTGGRGLCLTIFIGLLAGFGYSLYSIFGKVLVRTYDPVTVAAYTCVVASIASLLIAQPMEMLQIIGDNPDKMPLTIIGSVVTLAMPYALYSWGLTYMESSRASILASFEVVAASLFGVLLYGEHLSFLNIAGIACVVLALILLQIKPGENKKL